jgi:hypothetical protein
VVRLSFAYSGTLHAGTIDHCIVRAAVTEHSTALQQGRRGSFAHLAQGHAGTTLLLNCDRVYAAFSRIYYAHSVKAKQESQLSTSSLYSAVGA